MLRDLTLAIDDNYIKSQYITKTLQKLDKIAN